MFGESLDERFHLPLSLSLARSTVSCSAFSPSFISNYTGQRKNRSVDRKHLNEKEEKKTQRGWMLYPIPRNSYIPRIYRVSYSEHIIFINASSVYAPERTQYNFRRTYNFLYQTKFTSFIFSLFSVNFSVL